MVKLSTSAAILFGTAGANLLQGLAPGDYLPTTVLARFEARHDGTVTVTITETTCPEQGTATPPGYGSSTVSQETPVTSFSTTTTDLPSGSGSNTPPPAQSVSSGPPPVNTDTPPATVPTSVVPVPVPSAPETSAVVTPPTESVPTVNTTPVISSGSETTPTVTSVTSSTSTRASTTASTGSATPPAVNNGAGKFEFNTGVMVLLAVVALY